MSSQYEAELIQGEINDLSLLAIQLLIEIRELESKISALEGYGNTVLASICELSEALEKDGE